MDPRLTLCFGQVSHKLIPQKVFMGDGKLKPPRPTNFAPKQKDPPSKTKKRAKKEKRERIKRKESGKMCLKANKRQKASK